MKSKVLRAILALVSAVGSLASITLAITLPSEEPLWLHLAVDALAVAVIVTFAWLNSAADIDL